MLKDISKGKTKKQTKKEKQRAYLKVIQDVQPKSGMALAGFASEQNEQAVLKCWKGEHWKWK